MTKALDISRAGLGERHPLFAAAVRELGLTLAAAGESEEAERQLRRALAIAEDVHGARHPDVAGFLDALGDFYVEQRKPAAALELFARSIDIQDRYAADVLEIGSESFKTASLATAPDPIPRLLKLQSMAADVAGARTLAFEAVTRRKGRVLDQVRSWRQRLQSSGSALVRQQARDWQAMLECRTSLTVALGYRDLKPNLAGTCSLTGTELAGRYERLLSDLRSRWTADLGTQAVNAIAVLQQRAETIEASLNREAGGAPPAAAENVVHVDDLRRELGADEALVEFVSYADTGTASRRYGAFVLNNSGTLQWADLGPASTVDRSVADLLQSARDWSISVGGAEHAAAAASMKTADDALAELSARVWRPVQALLGPQPAVRRLRIAPDASLNLVPFEALPDSDGRRPLIDRFAIAYVPAGRDIMARAPAGEASAPVVVVSPGARSRRNAQGAAVGPEFRAESLAPLSAAAGEAADIRALVPATHVLTAANATEQHVKQLAAPLLLHVVGHGVVRDVVQNGADCAGPPCVSTGLDPIARAMSLAAIVLEEAYGRGRTSNDDGLLTALELQNMDLRGTEMLVLSQCQMASGAPSVGEGVYGMRRAALIAGARTFVAPLWNVEDGVQRRLMKRFYSGLAAGESRADALRQAKLALRRAPATSSFLYWAPVILSGDSRPLPMSLFR